MDVIWQRIAVRKGKVTDPTFRLFRFEWITDDTVLVEGSATVPYKSGKRKGHSKFIGHTTKATVSVAERDAERIAYEAETGKCCRCYGDGKSACAWGPMGTQYKPCAHCNATGKSQAITVTV